MVLLHWATCRSRDEVSREWWSCSSTNRLAMDAFVYDKEDWAHQSRRLWRRINLRAAAQRLPTVFDIDVDNVDWDTILLTKQLWHPMLDTIQSNALNSKSRCARHFRAPTTPYCEHHCPDHDDFRHRLLTCPATQAVRRRCHDGASTGRYRHTLGDTGDLGDGCPHTVGNGASNPGMHPSHPVASVCADQWRCHS